MKILIVNWMPLDKVGGMLYKLIQLIHSKDKKKIYVYFRL
jgi:hypothetical protein